MLLARHGYIVHGVDRSALLLAEARRNAPDATFEQQEIEAFEPAERQAGVVLWDVIFHLPRSAHEPLLQRIFAALDPGGVLEGYDKKHTCEPVQPQRQASNVRIRSLMEASSAGAGTRSGGRPAGNGIAGLMSLSRSDNLSM